MSRANDRRLAVHEVQEALQVLRYGHVRRAAVVNVVIEHLRAATKLLKGVEASKQVTEGGK